MIAFCYLILEIYDDRRAVRVEALRPLTLRKGVNNEGSVTRKNSDLASVWLAFWPNVKKVPNSRIQGLDPGEIVFRDFPFRLLKSRK